MKHNKIGGLNILTATTILLGILATGVNNEVITKAEISENVNSGIHKVVSINDRLQERLATNRGESQRDISSALELRQENSQWPTTCAEALLSGNGRSGIYQLYLRDYNLRPFEVQCLNDPDNGPAWTVIQRRLDNTTDFFRNWSEYKSGFGDLNTNYFIGLNRIHLMTKAEPHELWIELEDFQGESRYAKYNSFAIGDEYTLYALSTLGVYVGNAGDSLTYSKGAKFSTNDNDNDGSTLNCAANEKGAWWYQNCAHSNLNGKYQYGITTERDGMYWQHWRGYLYSYKYVHMAIRPKK